MTARRKVTKNSASGKAASTFLARLARESEDTSDFARRVAEHLLWARPDDEDDGPIARAYFGVFDTFELFGLEFEHSLEALEFLSSLSGRGMGGATEQLGRLPAKAFTAATVVDAIFAITELTREERRMICQNTMRLLEVLPGTPVALRTQVIANVLESGAAS